MHFRYFHALPTVLNNVAMLERIQHLYQVQQLHGQVIKDILQASIMLFIDLLLIWVRSFAGEYDIRPLLKPRKYRSNY